MSCLHSYLICGLPSWHVVSQGIIPLWREFPASVQVAQLFLFACQYLFGLPSTVDEKAVDSWNFSKQKSLSILKCLSQTYGTLLFEMLCSEKILCIGNVIGVKLCLSLHAVLMPNWQVFLVWILLTASGQGECMCLLSGMAVVLSLGPWQHWLHGVVSRREG